MCWLNVGAYNIINYVYNANSLGMIMFKLHVILYYKALYLFMFFHISQIGK